MILMPIKNTLKIEKNPLEFSGEKEATCLEPNKVWGNTYTKREPENFNNKAKQQRKGSRPAALTDDNKTRKERNEIAIS